jgi:2-succinyl-6-hydroxy-2,4-cyclohexadiene-1-carboxylate synthase
VLRIRRFGSGPEIIALHGFSLTGEHFKPAVNTYASSYTAPDLPGHGGSAAEPTDIAAVIAAVRETIDSTQGSKPVMGYSQGARIALLTALANPTGISALVLISGTAGIKDPTARGDRKKADEVFAAHIEAVGITEFVDKWTSEGIASVAHLDRRYREWDRSVRLENAAAGLAAALRGYGQGAQPSVWEDLGKLSLPVLLLHGETDQKFSTINAEMEDLLPNVERVAIKDAGHDPMADQAVSTWDAISGFLDRHRRA